jgi:hypothetical protein
VPRRDQSKLEEQREVSRFLDNLMHRRPRRFSPRVPRSGLYVHSLEHLELLDSATPRRSQERSGAER